jgi:hypothetical protein
MHISKHLQANLDIENSDGEKVRYPIKSIKPPFLDAATSTVRETDRYLESFDPTTTYQRTFIIACELTKQRNVASLSGSKQVHFNGKTCFNKKHPPTKRRYVRKSGGCKVRYPTT